MRLGAIDDSVSTAGPDAPSHAYPGYTISFFPSNRYMGSGPCLLLEAALPEHGEGWVRVLELEDIFLHHQVLVRSAEHPPPGVTLAEHYPAAPPVD